MVTDTGGVLLYGGEAPRDKNGNIIPEKRGGGCGCLVYPIVFVLLGVFSWYALKNLA